MANSQNRCVFVGNIPYDATEEQLIQICEEVGPVVSFRLVLDRETGKPKGYGFCEYKDEETALSARRNLQGYHINGRQLRVDFADNEKGSDRNREQGRGGPGLSLEPKPANLGDASLNQPVGLSLAGAASSVMAGALGDQNRVPVGTDSLTNYLASMSKNQLYEIMSELKELAKQNNQLARQIILACPQLAKAIFQGGIMLGMVPPKMLQMSDLRQTPVMLKAQSQDGQAEHMLLPPSRPPQLPPAQNRTQLALVQRPYDVQLLSMAPDPQTLQPTVLQQVVGQPRLSLMSQMAGPVFQQKGQASVSTSLATQGHSLNQLPSLHAQSMGATFLPSKPQLQPPLPQLPRPFGSTTVGKTQDAFPGPTFQPSIQPNALLNQWGPSSSTLALGGQQADSIDAGKLAPTINSLNLKIPSGGNENNGLSATASQAFPLLKQVKLEDEIEVPGLGMSNGSAWPAEPPSVIPDNYVQTHQVPNSNLMPKPEPQTFQLSGIDPALLQQVLKLKPEQLSSLSPEQRQQLIQLQQMLQ